jgi:hypothetical protein
MRTLVTSGTIVTASQATRADLLIEDDRIVEIAPSITAVADRILDASGKLVLPGRVDVHTHLDMPLGEITSSDDFESWCAGGSIVQAHTLRGGDLDRAGPDLRALPEERHHCPGVGRRPGDLRPASHDANLRRDPSHAGRLQPVRGPRGYGRHGDGPFPGPDHCRERTIRWACRGGGVPQARAEGDIGLAGPEKRMGQVE